MNFTFKPIGYIHSPFKQKFGIPRQSGLVPEIKVSLELV
jgi:tRNA (Thr-GGU) A37 N-methylase